MKILLILARQTRMESYHLPVGIGYVSASLKRAGHEVKVLNPNHSTEELTDLLAAEIMANQPDVIGTGGMAFHLTEVALTVKTARRILPQAKIVIGGPLVSNQPELVMAAIPEADFGVIGEGEQTTPELIAALESGTDVAQVMGLIYRTSMLDVSLKRTPSRPIENNLDELPWVDYEGLGLDVYAGLHRAGECAPALVADSSTRVMPLLTSRGCPYPCTFCCHEAAGRRYRARSLDEVFAEIRDAVKRFRINALFIYDDLFCLKRSRLVEFCERVKPLGLRWECSLRAGQIDENILALMKDSGCCCISIGVESMSPRVLESMQKKTTKKELERVLGLIYSAGIGLWSNLIFGDPMETYETAMESIHWWVDNHRYELRFANIGYHPGSRIYEEAVQQGLITDPLAHLLSGVPEINATSMTDEEYENLKLKVWELFLTFGYPGKILNIEPVDDGLFQVRAICPHCGENNMYGCLNLYKSSRISCKRCNQLYRLPVVFQKAPTEEFTALIDKLNSLVDQDASVETNPYLEQIWAVGWQIIDIDPAHEAIWELLFEIADHSGKPAHPAAVVDLMRQAIACNPYSIAFFESLADRLEVSGDSVDGARYRQQAVHLKEHDISAYYLPASA